MTATMTKKGTAVLQPGCVGNNVVNIDSAAPITNAAMSVIQRLLKPPTKAAANEPMTMRVSVVAVIPTWGAMRIPASPAKREPTTHVPAARTLTRYPRRIAPSSLLAAASVARPAVVRAKARDNPAVTRIAMPMLRRSAVPMVTPSA